MTSAILPAATDSLDLDPWVWWVTIGIAAAVLAFDVVWIARNPHRPSNRETGIALTVYIGAAILFGLGMWYFAGAQLAGEFYAGWLTEYSLSIDNLFIFIIIMASFKVPAIYQQQALLIGIVLALVFRGIFIALGAVAIQQFSWIFYFFAAFLIFTAIKLARDTEHSDDADNAVVRFAKTYLSEVWDTLPADDRAAAIEIAPAAVYVMAKPTVDPASIRNAMF